MKVGYRAIGMRYSITGATGFVGGELARQLRAAGHDVRALVRDPHRATELAGLGVELVAGDLDDLDALRRLAQDSDGLFHVAGWYKLGSRQPEQGRRVNVEGTRNVLTAAREVGVPRTVYTSTLAVNSDTHGTVVDESYRFTGRHLSVYDQTKAVAHDVARDFASSGLPLVTLMPGLVYGPGDTALSGTLIRDVAKGRRVVVPAGGGACWGYIVDIAAGHVLAMQRGTPGETYMLAGPRSTLADALRRVAAIAGTRSPLVLPNAMVRMTGRLMGPLGRLVPLPPQYAAESMRASLATYFGTPDKAERELGWSCRDLDAGLRETVVADDF
jgi:nucleoside-diphosphate-sugar epimerase